MATTRRPYTAPLVRVDRITLGVYGDYGGYDPQQTLPSSSGENPWQQLSQD